MKQKRSLLFILSLCSLCGLEKASAQVVLVTMSLDTNRISAGSSTTLRVFGQIVPAQRANTDRIFSWYIDLLNTTGSVARSNYDLLVKTSSDNDSRTSSSGVTDGANRRGIYDTFINSPGAGRDLPVELFSVPVEGLTPGRTSFRIQAGSGVTGLSSDFIVAPAGGGDPILGGDYSAASIEIEVTGATSGVRLALSAAPLPDGRSQRLTISYPVIAGRNYFVEFRSQLGSGLDWQALPGSPHNTGIVLDTNSAPQRFYRIRTGN